jgi:sulfur relay (sulfurtransferase) DsrC/TusE family protein
MEQSMRLMKRYLADLNQWSSEIAEKMAIDDGQTSTQSTLGVINFLREYY